MGNDVAKIELSYLSSSILKRMWKEFDAKFPKGSFTKKQFTNSNVQIKGGNHHFWDKLFNTIDSQKDGYIDFQEYHQTLIVKDSYKENPKQVEKYIFRLLDFNENGKVMFEDLLELCKIMNEMNICIDILKKSQLEPPQSEYCISMFKLVHPTQIDTQQGGYLSWKDFGECLKLKPFLLRAMIKVLDQRPILFNQSLNDYQNIFGKMTTSHQVGGHRDVLFTTECVYKPLVKEEFKFYEKIYNTLTRDHQILREITPKYYGKHFFIFPKNANTKNKTVFDCKKNRICHYVVLENLTKGMKAPCIIDCKMGKYGYAKRHSKKLHKKVYQKWIEENTTCKKYGFRFSGLKVYDLVKEKYICKSKKSGVLTKNSDVVETIKLFANNGKGVRKDILKSGLLEIEKIIDFFKIQKTYNFFSSSVLMIYDAMQDNDKMIVKLVDFAHIYNTNNGLDESVLFGLENLKTILSKIVFS